MKYGLTEEDMDMLYGILDSTYGDGSSREAPHDTAETGTTESETGTTEHESGEGARDYEPMTLAKAEATGNSMISMRIR